MTTVVRPASDNDGFAPEPAFDVYEAISQIEEQLGQLSSRDDDTEWVVDLQTRRVVRRSVGLGRRRS